MQKNTTDDEMGWAAHKKWLLIFLSKFCLRLCGDFCLLFSACSYPQYIRSLCMCNSPGTEYSSSLFSSCNFLFYFIFCSICVRCIFFLLLPPMMVLYSIHIWFVIAVAAIFILCNFFFISLCASVHFFYFCIYFLLWFFSVCFFFLILFSLHLLYPYSLLLLMLMLFFLVSERIERTCSRIGMRGAVRDESIIKRW